jgi:hypothetical protein
MRMLNTNSQLRSLAALICAACLLVPTSASAKKLTLLYVPLDNRPVCMDYVKQTMEAADCKIILPPEKYIASNEHDGNPEGIWDWLSTKAPKADAAVISTDSLLYGGLVASRTHYTDKKLLSERLERLSALKAALPIKLYAFSTIMRTPRASKGRVEPAYYSTLGPSIFAYSQLADKKDQGKLSPVEQLKLQAMERNLPQAELSDWLGRRAKNLQLNKELIRMTRNNKFHYLAIGKDDNATLSATHMEARKLSMDSFDMPADELQILDGVDQLGLLLLLRAYNETQGLKPSIYTLYNEGAAGNTLPQYSDERLQDSVPRQIIAAGAVQTNAPQSADLILALNSPADGIVKDSTADDNKFFASMSNKRFAEKLQDELNEGRSVSLADISYSNGADNGFMQLLALGDTLPRLAAYNGWNTADNAIGFAIAQGLLAKAMPERERESLLRIRLIDDWFYQSNARRLISEELEARNREELKYDLGNVEKEVLPTATQECQRLSEQYAFTKGIKYQLSFPWNRLFEVNVKLKSK